MKKTPYSLSRTRHLELPLSISESSEKQELRVLAYCLTALLCVSLVCGTVWGCYSIHEQQKTILEQQYALNMQYASLMEYVAGAEIETTTNTASADGRGTAVAGDGNTTVVGGGDLNGDS